VFEHWGRGLDPNAVAQALGSIDLDADAAACPACGTSFATADKRCPECGLRFG